MLIEERSKFTDVPFRKGRAEGLEEGRHEGAAILLKRQIERRFGPLSDNTRTRIESATSVQLEAWSLNILDANNLDDVFAD